MVSNLKTIVKSLVDQDAKYIQVVEQSSAVIEGRISDGLTTDHAGLNKYYNDKDPNLIKIANALASMAHSAKVKLEGATKSPQGTEKHISSLAQSNQ
jgi:hypothetical protein